jgi:Fur family ferric uptake transcriptional regulator
MRLNLDTAHSTNAAHGGASQRLRAAGQRATPQRVLVLNAFTPGDHLTASDVYARVMATTPGVNRSTIYRILEQLRDLGLLSETDLGGGARHFALLDAVPHHHLICQSCGQMTMLDDDPVQTLREVIAAQYGFVARIDHLAVFGCCAACCRARSAETALTSAQ